MAESDRAKVDSDDIPGANQGTALVRCQPSAGGDGRPEMSVEQIIALLENSSQGMVHTTPWPQRGMLREPLYPSYPTGRDDENAVRGVCAMRGLSGAPNGKYYVVFADDGRFGPYPNCEFICVRTLYPDEAVGWFTQQQLGRAKQVKKTLWARAAEHVGRLENSIIPDAAHRSRSRHSLPVNCAERSRPLTKNGGMSWLESTLPQNILRARSYVLGAALLK